MRRALVSPAIFMLFLLACGLVSARQVSQESPPVTTSSGEAPLLKVCLRLEDDSPFGGVMHVRLLPGEGDEISGAPTGSDGETVFRNLQPGAYFLEASAPGFVTIRREVRIDSGHGLQTLFVTMRPTTLRARPAEASLASPEVKPLLVPVGAASLLPAAPTRGAVPVAWIPPSLDDSVPDVDSSVACPLPDVLKMAGERMSELIANLDKFSATEHVEHFKINATGVRGSPDVRSFDYVALVFRNRTGLFQLDEYRNGTVDPGQFPAGIATEGLPAMALIFHPLLVPDFDFKCEGLGQWEGRPAWQVHFAQRPDRQSRIRQYVIRKNSYPVAIKGRAWIDPGTDQVVRLESELSKPIPEIGLTKERLAIEYGAVEFHSHEQRLWLPQMAELYVERMGSRYYRRHTFSNFKLFTVAAEESIQPPKESYVFTNTSDHDIVGVLTVTPVPGSTLLPVSITFTIPAGKTIFKAVGIGKDVNIPVASLGYASFAHNGPDGSITVNAYLTNDSSVDVSPNADISKAPGAPL